MEGKDKTLQNIDSEINKISYNIAKAINEKSKEGNSKYKNEVDKALGVLTNDGVYAYYVYVKYKGVDDILINKLFDGLNPFLKFIKVKDEGKKDTLNEEYFKQLSGNLNNLLFFRDLLERVLVYVRYHLKAMGE